MCVGVCMYTSFFPCPSAKEWKEGEEEVKKIPYRDEWGNTSPEFHSKNPQRIKIVSETPPPRLWVDRTKKFSWFTEKSVVRVVSERNMYEHARAHTRARLILAIVLPFIV